jgi:hypothetical protein
MRAVSLHLEEKPEYNAPTICATSTHQSLSYNRFSYIKNMSRPEHYQDNYEKVTRQCVQPALALSSSCIAYIYMGTWPLLQTRS